MNASPRSDNGNLARRVTFAAVAIPLALVIVWYGGAPLVCLLAVAGALGARELYALAERGGVRPARLPGIAGAALIPLLSYAAIAGVWGAELVRGAWPYAAAVWLILVLVWALGARAPDARPLEAVSVTVLGTFYCGALPAFLLVIRHGQHPLKSWGGAWLVFYPLVVTWVCDTAAMFGGRAIGGPRLAPTISPGKTRSGSLAGVVGALAVAPLFGLVIFPRAGVTAGIGALIIMAAVLGVVGQLGDLVESLFKREAGVKDSSTLIPGHGGVLDRLDSLYVVVPVAAVLYRLFGVI
jgi:phosphatidate cytidylyltransferase